MNLTLQRKKEVNNTVLGELSINGKFFCYTLEDKIRDVKIKNETCIPEGEYEIKLTLSQRFKTILPILLNVPRFEGIRIHAGNTIEDTSGCILVGSAIQGELLLHSKTTLLKLLDQVKYALKKEGVTIKVLNPIKEVVKPELKAESFSIEKPKEVIPAIIIPKENKTNFIHLINLIKQWLNRFL